MQVIFNNFGPIASGSLDLKPLTIMIGPNQSGKSFAAMATHALLKGISSALRPRWRPAYYTQDVIEFYDDPHPPTTFTKDLQRIHARASKLTANQPLILTPQDIAALEYLTPVYSLKESVRTSIEEVFAVNLPQLLHHKSTSGSISIRSDDWDMKVPLSNERPTVSFGLDAGQGLRIAYVDRRRKDSPASKDTSLIAFKPSEHSKHQDAGHFFASVRSSLRGMYTIPDLPARTVPFYLPAIRSGLLLSHRLFLSLLLRNVQRAGLELFSIPQMTGVTADFLQAMLRLQDTRDTPAKFSAIIDRYESMMTGGKVYAQRESTETLPAYRFKTSDGLDIPLNLTSSTVTEVAPIFLLLRRLAGPSGWIIIEEPESHLSPYNQALMARFLAALVNHGVRVLITTHSTFLLEQLNNLIAAHSITDKADRTRESIDPNLVAAHHLDPGKDGVGSRLCSLDVDPIEGIDVSDFVRVYEALYEEGFKYKKGRIAEDME